jgi:hypothetical protein
VQSAAAGAAPVSHQLFSTGRNAHLIKLESNNNQAMKPNVASLLPTGVMDGGAVMLPAQCPHNLYN